MNIIIGIFKFIFGFLFKSKPKKYTGDLQTDISSVKEETQKVQAKIEKDLVSEQEKLNAKVETVNDAVSEENIDESLDQLAALAKRKKEGAN